MKKRKCLVVSANCYNLFDLPSRLRPIRSPMSKILISHVTSVSLALGAANPLRLSWQSLRYRRLREYPPTVLPELCRKICWRCRRDTPMPRRLVQQIRKDLLTPLIREHMPPRSVSQRRQGPAPSGSTPTAIRMCGCPGVASVIPALAANMVPRRSITLLSRKQYG
jgi:hypothetical protein